MKFGVSVVNNNKWRAKNQLKFLNGYFRHRDRKKTVMNYRITNQKGEQRISNLNVNESASSLT